jgi:hypothetical protein
VPDVQYPDDTSSNPSTIRIEDLLATDEASPSTGQVPAREGLPRSFRMRADKHYVEMLDSPAPRPDGRQPTADTPSVAVPESAAEAATAMASVQAGRDLAKSLAALRACTNLLSDRGPALASAVAGNLIRAEVWRATCLLQTARLLRNEIVPVPKPVATHAIVDQIVKSIEPERRLRGITLDEQVSVGDSRITVDEELMVGALSALLLATIALQDEQAPLTVTLAVESHAAEVVFKVAQGQQRAPSDWRTESLLIASAARLVAASGGRMAVETNASGTDLRVSLPRERSVV